MRNNELTEVTNRQKFPKNNYFCYRWRILDYFSTSADRQKHEQDLQVGGKDRSLLSDKILQLHKARYQGSRQGLIADLAQDAMQFLDRRRKETRKTTEENILFAKAIRDLMQRTFKTLLAFSTELNTLLGLSELFITSSEPEVAGRIKEDGSMAYVQCSLSTTLFRLLVDGRNDTMAFYLLPTDNIGALTDLSPYSPVVEWKAQVNSAKGLFWVSETGALTGEMLEVACAELLRLLIGATQEMLSPDKKAQKSNANYDLLEVDPWINGSHTSDQMSSDFDLKSGYNLAEPIQSKFEIKKKRDGWKQINDTPVTSFQKPIPAATPVTKPFTPESQSFSITISTNYQAVPHAVSTQPPVSRNSVSDGTRTDSVPSLQSLLRNSDNYSTALANAPIAVAPVILDSDSKSEQVPFTASTEQAPSMVSATEAPIEPPPANIFSTEALIFNARKASAAPKASFDLKGEYFADKPQKKSNNTRGVANKRSTRKTNSKKSKKRK